MENFMFNSRTRPALIRSGLTLIEILIALTMTLIVLGAMMTAFAYASQQMQMGRATMEMANRLRVAEEILRSDLAHATVDPRPYTESTIPNGYWEYVEGIWFPWISGLTGTDYLGDIDDIWAATVRSDTRPFRGRYIEPNNTIGAAMYPTLANPSTITTQIIESPLAEVVWWTDFEDANGDFKLNFSESLIVYRRVLLIVPPTVTLPTFTNFGAAASYLATNDISARIVEFVDAGTTYYQLVANTLEGLANRQVRFCHNPVLGASVGAAPTPAGYPHRLNRNTLWLMRSADYNTNGSLDLAGGGTFAMQPNGSDIMLTDVATFNVQVYSPQAEVLDMNAHPTYPANLIVEPSDPGYQAAWDALPLPRPVPDPVVKPIGAFVSLDNQLGPAAFPNSPDWFSKGPKAKAGLFYGFLFDYRVPRDLPGPPFVPGVWSAGRDCVYDTWTPLYESDGIDQDGVDGIDQGTNGLNNGGTPAPDDDAERETVPPYPYPVRGVKITIGLIEKTTKQVQQTSVIHSYVPE